MAYKSLRDFIALLEAEGELVRVSEPVSTHLEMTEIQTRLLRNGGPAVIFEKPVMPDGSISPIPCLANLFGTVKRVAMGVTMYAVVVGLVYHVLLHATWNPQGWSLVANILLHYVMPTAMLLDWLLFTAKGRLRWIDPVKWLAFPLVYGGWTLIHGYAAGWWPYWFVDVSTLGLGRAALYFAGLLAFFLCVGLAVAAIDRRLGRRDRTPAPA